MDQPSIDGYYGIPNRLGHNGTYVEGSMHSSDLGERFTTCVASHEADQESLCRPMEKLFYLQYQWFPFYMAFVALFYYLPYVLFTVVNSDLSSLKNDISKQDCDTDDLVKNYFNLETNEPTRQMMRVILNVLVKVLYMIANVFVLTFTNGLLNDQFTSFGSNWLSWNRQDNEAKHSYMGLRGVHAGQRLLPVFGMCDVLELGKDIKHRLFNEYSLVCEISQHVLYHYVLFAIWFLIVIGLVLSVVGIIQHVVSHLLRTKLFSTEEETTQKVYSALTIRESEYLNFIRRKNQIVFGSLVRAIYKQRFEIKGDRMDNKRDMMQDDDTQF